MEILSEMPRRELVGLSRHVPEEGGSGGREERQVKDKGQENRVEGVGASSEKGKGVVRGQPESRGVVVGVQYGWAVKDSLLDSGRVQIEFSISSSLFSNRASHPHKSQHLIDPWPQPTTFQELNEVR